LERSVHQLASDQGADRDSDISALIAISALADLTLLLEGGFGRPQRRSLILSRLSAIFGTIGMALLTGLYIAMGIHLLGNRPVYPVELMLLCTGMSAVCLWLLRDCLMLAVRIGRDLRTGRSSSVYGEIWCSHTMSPGVVRLPRYHIKVAGRRFVVKYPIFAQFRPNRHYQVFFAPDSGCFLGALALSPRRRLRRRPESSRARTLPVASAQRATQRVPEVPAPTSDLTAQEREILRLIAAGLSNKEIAARLSLSVNTIKMYCSQIYLKLDVHRRTEAVARAREIGLL
jgi:DNA-binding CsgD family transcriptional regulator